MKRVEGDGGGVPIDFKREKPSVNRNLHAPEGEKWEEARQRQGGAVKLIAVNAG